VNEIYIEAEGHWKGREPERYCGRLVLEAASIADAEALAALYRALLSGGSQALRVVAARSEEALAGAGGPALPFTL
jgi:hypothetical protein